VRWFLRSAFACAVIYSALAAWLLIKVLDTPDGVSASAGVFVVGAPWIWSGIFGRYYWLAIPMNALTLYFLIVLSVAIYQKGFQSRSR
jgi:hypothetical protein